MQQAALIAAHIRNADSILVVTHANPDGDAVGSLGAMGHVLAALGKTFALYNISGVPGYLDWVPLPSAVVRTLPDVPFTPDLVIVLDCGDAHRAGEEFLAALPGMKATVNIDHHLGNPNFGTAANWVDPTMAATGQMVAAVAHALDVQLVGNLATCLYVALVSDTGSFSFGNTSAAVLALASELVAGGVDVEAVTEHHDNQWSLAKTRLWGRLMQDMELAYGDTVAVSVITDDLLRACGARRSDLEGFANQMRRIRTVRIALLVRDDAPGRCKVSMRSSGPDDVRAVAASFGGGGHRNAAGITLEMDAAQGARAVLAAIPAHMDLGHNQLDVQEA